MQENPTTEKVLTPEEEQAVVFNKKVAAAVSEYFKALAEISSDEIYALAFTDAGKESPRLLEIVNGAYTKMLKEAGDVPRIYFGNYKKMVSDFNNTLVYNIDSKFEANVDALVAVAVGKTEKPEDISHKDIIDAQTK